jgi:hypothetical protein
MALAVQTDVIGVPWLAYALWWLAGAFVVTDRRRGTSPERSSGTSS